ncbi:TPA: ATP-binding protein, partial [Campylobacter upsaliensis]|nr:ATP-binding protein [Campylobacter upsaliensis]
MHPELDLHQMVDFYSVFDGLWVEYFSNDIFDSIKALILPNYKLLDEKFLINETEEKALILF